MWRGWRNTSSPSPTPPKDNHLTSKLGPLSSESPRLSPSPSLSHSHSNSNSSLFRCSSFKDIESLCHDSSSDEPSSDPPSRPLKTSLPQPSNPRRSVYHRTRIAKSLLRQWAPQSDTTPASLPEPEPEKPRVTVYYTSLRVVRPTFEACRSVLSVLQGFRVALDQRDVAMDAGFMPELRERMMNIKSKDDVKLPRVFIGSEYIGGAEEVLDLNEIGELKKMVQGLPVRPLGTCETCGGYKFVMCVECDGSRKIYSDKAGFGLCTLCNENGLIRCPQCSCHSPPPPPPSTAFLNASS